MTNPQNFPPAAGFPKFSDSGIAVSYKKLLTHFFSGIAVSYKKLINTSCLQIADNISLGDAKMFILKNPWQFDSIQINISGENANLDPAAAARSGWFRSGSGVSSSSFRVPNAFGNRNELGDAQIRYGTIGNVLWPLGLC